MGRIANQLLQLLKPQNNPVVDLGAISKAKKHGAELAKSIHAPEKLIQQGHDPLHALFASGQNLMSVFAEQVSPLPPLHEWHEFMERNEELYMPSGPPMSPLTGSYFGFWTLCDVTIGKDRETIGTIMVALANRIGLDPLQLEIAKNLSASRMGIYEVRSVSGDVHELAELITEKVIKAKMISGYVGKPGDLIYIRLAPPISVFDYHVCITTPYILLGHTKIEWVAFFKRNQIVQGTVGCDYRLNQFMKNGKKARYWSEYVFYAYMNHEADRIFLAGMPDRLETQPCSDKFKKEKFNESLIALQLGKVNQAPTGTLKASEIFLKYMEPMFELIPKGIKAKDLEPIVRIPEMVWNALAVKEWDPNKPDVIEMLHNQLTNVPAKIDRHRMPGLIDMLIERKRKLYPDAKWAFEISVRDDGDGGHVFRAFTRIPDHLRHTVPVEWLKNGNVRPLHFGANNRNSDEART